MKLNFRLLMAIVSIVVGIMKLIMQLRTYMIYDLSLKIQKSCTSCYYIVGEFDVGETIIKPVETDTIIKYSRGDSGKV